MSRALQWFAFSVLLLMAQLSASARQTEPQNAAPFVIEKRPGAILTGLRSQTAVRVGRILSDEDGTGQVSYTRQWPGTYFETYFDGDDISFRVGEGPVHLAITVDNSPPVRLLRPSPGIYRVSGLPYGKHHIRIQVISESWEPTVFGGFQVPIFDLRALWGSAKRQIEFVGDSWTVGYGNTSETRDCDETAVWETTDTSRGPAGVLASRLDADYRVHAISGRGVIRNYNGGPDATLPEAYPFILFEGDHPATDDNWSPRLIIVSLGTNDFSTPTRPEEGWASAEAFREDFVRSYMAFLQELRGRHPGAYILLWASADNASVHGAAQDTVSRLQAQGFSDVGFVPVSGLQLDGCHWHPGLADGQRIADAIAGFISANPAIWD